MQKIVGCLLLLGIVGCESKPLPAPLSKTGPVIASVDDFQVSQSDLEGLIEEIESKTPQVIQSFQQKRELAQELVHVQLLYEAALKAGFADSFQFKSKLAEVFIEAMERDLRESLSAQEIERFYQQNKQNFDEVSARHILLRANESTSRQDRLEILQKLEGWKKIVDNEPSRFMELARQHSQDSTAVNGGELGFFVRARMVGPFSAAAFALKEVGEVSDIVKTEFGYHLIQLSGDRRGFEHHEALIRTELTRRQKQKRLQEILSQLKEGREIEIFDAEIQAMTSIPAEMTEDPNQVLPEDFDDKKP
jgi:parvulin-like peptidyl-prolyl isomerase